MHRTHIKRRGATMVTVAILLPVMFLLSAIAVNLAYIQVVTTKVQIVTDVSVRAAGAAYVESGDELAGLAAAQQLASLNPIESTVLSITGSDLEFGLSQRNTHTTKPIRSRRAPMVIQFV